MMDASFNFDLLPGENEYQYRWRIYQAKQCGALDMDWVQIAAKIDAKLRSDEPPYSESVYRKEAALVAKWREKVFLGDIDDSSAVVMEQIYKAKRQLFDQRREYNKLLTADARSAHLSEILLASVQEMNTNYPMMCFTSPSGTAEKQKEAVLFIADLHYGMVVKNIWNEYSPEICKQRLASVAIKTINACKLHEVEKVNVVLLGDLVHGAIHTTARIAAEEDTVDQLMQVSEILAQVISAITNSGFVVDVHSAYGNHARAVQNKKDSIHTDNMERIVPWWLRHRLQDNQAVRVLDSDYYELVKFTVLGWNLCCAHGDLDTVKDFGIVANTIFTKRFGETIDYAIVADKHHLEEFEKMGVESVLVRSLCGADNYAMDNRLLSLPAQTLMFFNREDGRECTYSVKP